MVKIVQMAKGYTFCHIKSLWKQYSSPILNTSEWCVKFFFYLWSLKIWFDPDPEVDPDPELSEKSDPEPDPDPEIIFSAPIRWFLYLNSKIVDSRRKKAFHGTLSCSEWEATGLLCESSSAALSWLQVGTQTHNSISFFFLMPLFCDNLQYLLILSKSFLFL